MVRLKVFIVAEISEDDEDDEQPSDVLEQAASTSDLAKIAETLEAAGTRAVEKGAEARVEDLAATLAAMTGEQRAALLIKVAQSQPRTLR